MNGVQTYFVEEFAEEYRYGRMSRRDLLRRVLLITGSAPIAAEVLLTLGCGSKSATPPPLKSQSQSTANAGVAPPIQASAQALGVSTMPPAAQ